MRVNCIKTAGYISLVSLMEVGTYFGLKYNAADYLENQRR